jgi:hypothetical protein
MRNINLESINFKKVNGSVLLVLFVGISFLPHKRLTLAQAVSYPLLLAICGLITLYMVGFLLVVFGSFAGAILKPVAIKYWNWIQK